ncbi:TRAP transporter large permease [Aquibacillus sediminis]|uniref:TRAP transporter large permease n=1 Tax=Aquibacillus sediminis TaxID=2574734 RepID=UPI001109927F|nr:TRAP transporter large permease [Aquibacillus sediminis]
MTATLIPLALLFLLLAFPVFLSILIPSFIALDIHFPMQNIDVLIQQMFGGVNTYSLLAIPFFMFAADVISRGQIGKRLIEVANTLVGFLPGGLAMATVVTCIFFGAISGAGSAAVVAIGGIVYPIMIEKGYGSKFTVGLILASSSLAMLIPPGIGMILYSTIYPASSIKDMFAAGILLGLITGGVFMTYSCYYAIKNNIPRDKFVGFGNLFKALLQAGWALGLPVIILLGIYLGITTVTEAAAIAVIYALFVEMVVYRELSIRDLYKTTIRSGTLIAMLLVLISAGKAISYLMTMGGLPQLISQLLGDYSTLVILLLINFVFLIVGMFIDPNSAIIIMTPLVAPIATTMGIDPVHLGMIIVFNLSIGMITPPFGLNLFIAQGAFKIPYAKIIPGTIPFILCTIGVLIVINLAPGVIMWLPNLLN